ncbi:hypothetical protein AB4Z21_09770, partial [Paenibacillus sp. MCAF20]
MNPNPGFMGNRMPPLPAKKPARGSIWSMYKRMFLHVRAQWMLMAAAFICIIAVSLLEFAIPRLTQWTIDDIIPSQRYDSLIWVALGVLGTA